MTKEKKPAATTGRLVRPAEEAPIELSERDLNKVAGGGKGKAGVTKIG